MNGLSPAREDRSYNSNINSMSAGKRSASYSGLKAFDTSINGNSPIFLNNLQTGSPGRSHSTDDLSMNRSNGRARTKPKAVTASSPSTTISCNERLYVIANRVQHSRAYSSFYILMILLNFALLLVVAINSSQVESVGFAVCEVIVTLFLFLEILMKMATQRKNYWHRCSNWFDIVVLIICLMSLVIFAEIKVKDEGGIQRLDQVLLTALLVLRYIAQLLRLISMLKERKRLLEMVKQQQRQRHSDEDIIDFRSLDGDPDLDQVGHDVNSRRYNLGYSLHHQEKQSWNAGVNSNRSNGVDNDHFSTISIESGSYSPSSNQLVKSSSHNNFNTFRDGDSNNAIALS